LLLAVLVCSDEKQTFLIDFLIGLSRVFRQT
jgi:hypothetical protein